MTANHYAQAIFRATRGRTQKEVDQRIDALLHLLESRGHLRLLPRIAASVERFIAEDVRGREVVVAVAKRGDLERFAPMIERYRGALGAAQDAPVRDRVDATLIGGFRLRTRSSLFDATHKCALLQLYRQLLSVARNGKSRA